MYRNNKKDLKNFFQRSYDDNFELFSKNTVNGLLRSLFEPIAANNAVSLILTRFKHTNSLEGIIKRLEYCSNVEMYSFLDYDNILKDDFVETEFVIITSQRYNAVLIWDYSDSKDKNETKLYIRLNSKDVNKVFETVDVLLSPTCPYTAFEIGSKVADPLSMYLTDIGTISANLAGIPGMSIPCGFDNSSMPVGMQLLAPALQEEKLLNAAYNFEQATDFHTKTPALAAV